MKLNALLNNNKTYIVAVSFGPDSMCLLDLLNKENCNLVVAHVNYHRRSESNSEQERLEKFCKSKNIRIEILDTSNLKPTGNFQKWAREIRYEFFAKLVKKYDAECVFVAHQQDDLIETYLMQKNKKSVVKYWGIAKKNTIKNTQIVRPLLSYSKAELQDYCDTNKVPYAIDSSNLEDHYERNKIRHSIVQQMTIDERKKIIKEINEKNKKKKREITTVLNLNDFLNLNYDDIVQFISNFLILNNVHIDLSKDFVSEIKKAFKSKKSNVAIKLTNGFFILKEYDVVFLLNENKSITYSYILYKNDKISDEYFDIDLTSNFEERNISDDMFPLIIKPVSKDDEYKVTNYICKVRRLFIDWKVPSHLRKCWPGIYDKNNKLVYIPRYRKTFVDDQTTKFIIKFTNK